MKKCKIIPFPVFKLDVVETHNCEAIAEGINEHKNLYAIKSTFISIDRRNGKLGDEPLVNHGLNMVIKSIEQNESQVRHDRLEQEVFDEVNKFSNVIELYPVKKNRIA
jgi:hypothetical protein